MSMNKIKKMDSEQLLQFQKEVVDELLLKIQKEYDNNLYETKKSSDKLICQICGGKYTRCSKSKHYCSDKHKNCVRGIHADISNAIYKNLSD